MEHWLFGDIPRIEHRRHYGDCPFIRGEDVGNIPMTSSRVDQGSQTRESSLLASAKFPRYAEPTRRMATFGDRLTHQTMVDAGFWRDGTVYRCFYCAVHLLEEPKDPFETHARLMPACNFLRKVKGVDFVAKVTTEDYNARLLTSLKIEKNCKVCMNADVAMTCVPCGHLSCCLKCGPLVGRCPICRAGITSMLKTFMN